MSDGTINFPTRSTPPDTPIAGRVKFWADETTKIPYYTDDSGISKSLLGADGVDGADGADGAGGGSTTVYETLVMEDANTTQPVVNTSAVAFVNTFEDTISTLGSYTNDTTAGFTYTATIDHIVSLTVSICLSSSGTWSGITVDGDLTTSFLDAANNGKRRCTIYGVTASRGFTGNATVKLLAGQVIALHTQGSSLINGQYYGSSVNLTAWSI